ncbi:MAG: hypothetical protein ACYC4L_11140 [Chloroflexota bacterium]
MTKQVQHSAMIRNTAPDGVVVPVARGIKMWAPAARDIIHPFVPPRQN